MSPSLEKDVLGSDLIKDMLSLDDTFAKEFYAALCNTTWYKNGDLWHCSWRYAGQIVADLVSRGDYMTFYSSGNEAQVTDRVAYLLNKVGWTTYSRI